MGKAFKQQVQDHIRQQSLGDDEYQRLLKLSAADDGIDSGWQRRFLDRPGYLLLATAASVMVAILALLLVVGAPESERLQRIAAEVAENHIKLKPLEVATSSMQDIRSYFTQLDFVPTQSRLLDINTWQLTGGRYCSIQGKTAAQLRVLQSESGKLQTLYQVEYDPAAHGPVPDLDKGEMPLSRYARGLEVRLWTEKGLLFAMTAE